MATGGEDVRQTRRVDQRGHAIGVLVLDDFEGDFLPLAVDHGFPVILVAGRGACLGRPSVIRAARGRWVGRLHQGFPVLSRLVPTVEFLVLATEVANTAVVCVMQMLPS